MTWSEGLRNRLALPVICAPMFLVSGPAMVAEACKAGIVGALPRQNARTADEFEEWLRRIAEDVAEYRDRNPGRKTGPVAVNISPRVTGDDLTVCLDACRRHGVELIISAHGNPADLTQRVHDWGGRIFHDVTTIRFAEKAIAASVDGLNCIGVGGGGHSGSLSHLALIPKVRAMFDGTVILAGGVSTGSAVRAAEVLGADLVYMGTRFIATEESQADAEYKDMIVAGGATDTVFTGNIAGVPASWLVASIRRAGMDPGNLPQPKTQGFSHDHLPSGVRPWKNVWSAGQGIELIDDIPPIRDLVATLRREYVEACSVPDMRAAAETG